jgi:pyruvate formate lyase activating enzyme
MRKGLVFDIKRYAIHDGPGIRTTVFFKGCPLNCLWCDNPESQRFTKEFIFWPERCLHCDSCVVVCKEKAIIKNEGCRGVEETKCNYCGDCIQECYSEALQIIGKEMSAEELVKEVEKDVDFFRESGGGVTFAGGEPFSQADFLIDVLKGCKGRNLHTAMETCGFVSWDILERVSPHVDLFLYDIKHMNEDKHKTLTGVSNRLILSNLERIAAMNEVIVRMPLIPDINDDEENIKAVGAFLSRLGKIGEVHLLPYHRLGVSKYEKLKKEYRLHKIAPPVQGGIEAVQRVLEQFGLRVNVGG